MKLDKADFHSLPLDVFLSQYELLSGRQVGGVRKVKSGLVDKQLNGLWRLRGRNGGEDRDGLDLDRLIELEMQLYISSKILRVQA